MGKPAARTTDLHTCPVPTHVGGPVMMGALSVLIGGMPAATLGTTCTCAGPPDMIVQGSFSVFFEGRPAARMGDMTAHGGIISSGCPTVLIGDVGLPSLGAMAGITQGLDADTAALVSQRVAFGQAAATGALGCEACE